MSPLLSDHASRQARMERRDERAGHRTTALVLAGKGRSTRTHRKRGIRCALNVSAPHLAHCDQM